MSRPTVLWLDDQLDSPEQRPTLQDYINILNKLDIDLIETADINQMFALLKKYKENNQQISGILIDLMLPQSQPNARFNTWGLDNLKLNHGIGGIQIIKLMRHQDYVSCRIDTNHPLNIMNHYVNTKLALFTTYENGEECCKTYSVENLCTLIYKDKDNMQAELINWIAQL